MNKNISIRKEKKANLLKRASLRQKNTYIFRLSFPCESHLKCDLWYLRQEFIAPLKGIKKIRITDNYHRN